MNRWKVRLEIEVHGSVGNCQVSYRADSPIQPGSEVASDVSSKVSQIINVGFVGLVVPRHIPYHVCDVSENSCGVHMISEVLQDQNQLFGDVGKADIALLDVVGRVCQVVVEESVVQLAAVLVEVPEVIGSDVRYAA